MSSLSGWWYPFQARVGQRAEEDEGGTPFFYPLILMLGVLCGCGIATFSVGIGQVAYWFPKARQGTALGTSLVQVGGGYISDRIGGETTGILALGFAIPPFMGNGNAPGPLRLREWRMYRGEKT